MDKKSQKILTEYKSKKVNIYTLFANIPSFIYILPIPILQHILFNPLGFWEHITSYSLSLFLFVAVSGFFTADYLTKKYFPFDEFTYIQKGFPIRSRFCIPYNRLQSVIIQSSPFTLLFSAVKIQLNTPSAKAKKGDAVFYLTKDKAQKLINEIYDDIGYISRYYKAKNSKIFFMSAIWSNPVSGLLILSPFIKNIGKIAGEELKNELLTSFDLSQYLVYIGLPPTTAFIAYVLLVCYSVSVFADFVRNSNFICTSYRNGILIRRGFIKRTLFMTNQSKINAVTISQSFVMLPFCLYSAYIHTVGAGKTKGDKSLLIAAEKKDTVKHLLSHIFTNLNLNFGYIIKPVRRAFRAYIRLPMYLLLADIILLVAAVRRNLFGGILLSFMLVSIPLLIVWCIFRGLAFRKAAVSSNDRFVFLRTFERLTFKATIIPLEKIQLCVKRANFFQKRDNTCNVRIYIYGEKKLYVEIKHIAQNQADKLIADINSNIK